MVCWTASAACNEAKWSVLFYLLQRTTSAALALIIVHRSSSVMFVRSVHNTSDSTSWIMCVLTSTSLFFYLLWLMSINFRHWQRTSWTHAFLPVPCRKWSPWFSCGVTECEAGWMRGLVKGQTRAETWEETDRGGRVWRPCRLTWASSSPERSRSGAAWPSLPGKRTKGRRFDTPAAPNWTRHRTRQPQRQRRG